MYCKYAEYACKFQKNLPMTNKTCDSMQKKMQHRIVIYNMQNKQVFAQKNLFMINQKWPTMQKKCNIVIRRSKNTSFTHI